MPTSHCDSCDRPAVVAIVMAAPPGSDDVGLAGVDLCTFHFVDYCNEVVGKAAEFVAKKAVSR